MDDKYRPFSQRRYKRKLAILAMVGDEILEYESGTTRDRLAKEPGNSCEWIRVCKLQVVEPLLQRRRLLLLCGG